MEKLKIIPKSKIDKLLKTTGVYLFYEKSNIIYIGKAVNIKERVKNHFFQPSYRDNLFIKKIIKIGFIETQSEIEALILESNLIKKNQPRFNVTWRDDKNYFYVAIAQNKEGIPYVFITHQPTKKLQVTSYKSQEKYVGPFVDGNSLKKALKYLRRVFSYYTSQKHPKNKCPWCHLDLCPGPEPNLPEYKKNIKKLILVLEGKRKNVLNSIKKEMKELSDSQEYENALKARDKIRSLEGVMAHAKVISSQQLAHGNHWDNTREILKKILNIENSVERIECYDVSNIQGKNATGAMVVFKDGQPQKSQYKKFRIKMKQEPNDIAMLKEIFGRRFRHREWKYPQVILVDGGRAQLNAAIKIKNKGHKTKNIKVISIAKGRQELFIEGKKNPIPLKKLPQKFYNLVKHLDSEAHRFAVTYHKKLRKKSLLDI